MWFDLTLEARDGGRHHVRYNPHTSECEGLPLPVEPGIFAPVPRVAKDKPIGKSRVPRVLKIQLGLSCNYACSYCSQAFQIADATVSKLADVEHFLTQLDSWITDAPEKIELWGGEPFLYWAKIKRLIPALAERFPAARFSIVTNGSLLSREKIDFIAKYDIEITISHDGPGQHLRGPDPFDDPDKSHRIQTLLAERPEKTGFNAVLTRQHHDLRALKAWFAEKVGPDIFVGLEGVVNVYDAATAIGTGRFEPAELNSLTRSIFEALVEFLTPAFAEEGPRPLAALGVTAQALRHLNFLIADPIPAAVLYRSGVLVQIPRPERFAIHKLIVAERREGRDRLKAEKDRRQAAFLIAALAEDRPQELREAYEDALSRGPKWRDRLAASLARMPETAQALAG